MSRVDDNRRAACLAFEKGRATCALRALRSHFAGRVNFAGPTAKKRSKTSLMQWNAPTQGDEMLGHLSALLADEQQRDMAVKCFQVSQHVDFKRLFRNCFRKAQRAAIDHPVIAAREKHATHPAKQHA